MSDNLVSLTIDGIKVSLEKGSTILDAAQKKKVYIPTLCHYPELTRFGACRLCLVEVEGFRKLVAACTTPATEGMVVHTVTPEINDMRKTVVELLLLHHPLDCLTCDRGGDCELQKLAFTLRVTGDRFGFKTEEYPVDDTNLFIQRNFKKCVLCGRCVRVCDETRNVGALGFYERGFSTVIGYPYNKLVNCEYCGQCLSVCPVGALICKLSAYEARPWQVEKQRSICAYCGCGCSLYLEHKKNNLVKVSSEYGMGANNGLLCVKGRFGYDFVGSEKRLTSPLIKVNNSFKQVGWAQALGYIADGFKKVIENKGAQSVAGAAGARCTNEADYLFQKFMRAALGTNNVDSSVRLEHAPSISAMLGALGVAGATNSLAELKQTDAILLIGSNITASQVIAGIYVKQAVRQYGAKLIVIDPRSLEISRFADVWLRPEPGTDLALINGLLHIIIKEGLQDQEFIDKDTIGFADFLQSIKEYTQQQVEKITGVPAGQLEQAARLFAGAKTGSIVYGMGITQHSQGTDNVSALINLSLATGKLGRKNCGIYPLRTTCNSQGVADMGVLPDYYPGYTACDDMDGRRHFARGWGVDLPDKKGLYLPQMLEAAKEGKLSAMYIMGENLLSAYPERKQVEEALCALDFLVVQDIFLTETAKMADVVLPAASFAEESGTFTNLERRVQPVKAAISPPGEAKPDWEIIAGISNACGFVMDYAASREITEEIGRLAPLYKGINSEVLGTDGVFWPLDDNNKTGKPYFSMSDFYEGKGRFTAVDYQSEAENSEYPFMLITGGILFHHGSGAMSNRTKGLNYLNATGYVEINPEDADRLGLVEGDLVEVVSAGGKIEVKAKIADRYRSGIVFVPGNFIDLPVNKVMQVKADGASHMPAAKLTPVKIRKVT